MLVGKIVERKAMPVFFVEEGIVDKRGAIEFLGGALGDDKFDELYRVCADKQGGMKATYRKSNLYRRYVQLCEGPREASDV